MTPTILIHALRDLRGGMRHLRLLFICLALGVMVMSCIGSLVGGVRAGIDRDARALLGGDIEIRQLYKPVPMRAIAYMMLNGQDISRIADLRAMAERGDERTLVELKAIDDQYPLYGKLELKDIQGKNIFFDASHRGIYGAAVEQSLLDKLNIKPGETFKVNGTLFRVQAVIAGEPDRSVSALSLGSRVMISKQALKATGLITYGSMINFRYRVKLAPGTDLEAWKKRLAELFPEAHWNVRDWHDAAPGLTRMIERLSLFFGLTGITALIVAGIGIANATGIYLWSKRETIAAFKCMGASQAHVSRVYLLQVTIVGLCAIAGGLLLGVLAEMLLFHFFGDLLPVRGESGVFIEPLALSAGLGLLTVLLFSLWPLRQAAAIKPASLFRGYVDSFPLPRPGKTEWSALLYPLLVAAMTALAVRFTGTVSIPLYFTGGMLLAMALLYGISAAIKHFALKRAHSGSDRLTFAMALANLARPGAATTSMVIALGIGMTLLIALTLVGSNLRAQLEEGLPENAPAFFLVDIQPSQRDALRDRLKSLPEARAVTDLPMLRGRITRLNGVPVDQQSVSPEARWAIQGDRGLTYAAQPPENAHIVEGTWWDKDYRGPPLVSFDAGLARGMGLKPGDTITVAALDREITATITNLRDIQWGSLEMNFAIILSPGALAGLPETYIATVSAPPEGEKPIQRMLAAEFPEVAVVRVREALGQISAMLERISNAVLVTAAMTILCGVLVMASAIHASLHKRQFDTVMLKVLGVTGRRILGIYLCEFGLAAAAAALLAVVIGSLAAWGIMQLMIFSRFVLMPWVVAATLSVSLLIAVTLGLAATHMALKVRPLSLLRNE